MTIPAASLEYIQMVTQLVKNMTGPINIHTHSPPGSTICAVDLFQRGFQQFLLIYMFIVIINCRQVFGKELM